ncbi:helix-hairpin-helix domain-containing protein [Calothrix sp. FACHB-1219]|uniref:phospholipase D-like domain-containing protein n=1 Tax=unclassified Calothrix TaxID=2619626 RepID=UPI001688ECCE|nr:phospholipase D-like domain-containing protein [Calothrix sp. FACHB-168]MBD2205391.1 helix-hairpin-helix domain-containing protein [Calothrix sp. FACHB-168]MBD2218522.1 helix-hairpin-helix domain-containing protein [Calothrix sp. FACHB-1219]
MQIPSSLKYYFTFFLIFTITACERVQSYNKLPEPLPQDPFVQVYFNNSQSSEFSEPYRQQTRLGDNLEQQIVNAISQAKSTVDVAVQELRLPKVAQALAARQKAGVKVRVILENTYSRAWSSFTPEEISKLEKREQERYQEFRKFIDINQDNELSAEEINQRDALAIIQNAQVPWLDDTADGSAGSSLMHHKFVIVDNKIVIVTSANFTLSDVLGDFSNSSSLGNANNFLQIESSELATLFTEEFNIMWGDGPGGKPDSIFGVKKPLRLPKTITLGDTKITVQFSPTSATQPWLNSTNGLIAKALESATKSVDMALFVFSDQRLANILENRHQQNVQIRALIEPQFAFRSYSEALDMMGFALSEECKYEVDNKPWQNPITSVGVPILPKGDLLHHKFAVVDEKTVITGSHNWSEAANNGNDETLLVIENPTIAAHYVREFNRLYGTVRLGLSTATQQKIASEVKQCQQIQSPTSILPQTPTKLNINTASVEELATLPGVGKKLAQRIVITRQQHKFNSLQDLEKVPGISNKMINKWQDTITF